MRANFGFTVHFLRIVSLCAISWVLLPSTAKAGQPKRNGHVNDWAFTVEEADKMQREQDDAARQFLRTNKKRQNADLAEMGGRRIEPTKAAQTAQAQAFARTQAEATFNLLISNRLRLLGGIDALQKQIKDGGVRFPVNVKIPTALAAILKEWSEGDTGKRMAEYEQMNPENRNTHLAADKVWLIDTLARVELALQMVTYAEKSVAIVRGAIPADRDRLYSTEANVASPRWKKLLSIAAGQAKNEFATPHADSLFHPTRSDLALAHPSSATDNGQDIAANLAWHKRMMADTSNAAVANHLLRLHSRWGTAPVTGR